MIVPRGKQKNTMTYFRTPVWGLTRIAIVMLSTMVHSTPVSVAQIDDVYVVGRQVSVFLRKPFLQQQAVNMTLVTRDDNLSSPIRWAVVANSSNLSSWLRLPATSGAIKGSFTLVELRVVSHGLRERNIPYEDTLRFELHSMFGVVARHEFHVSLRVEAALHYFAWGRLGSSLTCPPPVVQSTKKTSSFVDVELREPFTQCDVDMLPLVNPLPSDDRHRLLVDVVVSGQPHKVIADSIEFIGEGEYSTRVTIPTFGPFELHVHFGLRTISLVGNASCISPFVPLHNRGCGCGDGFFKAAEGGCAACAGEAKSSSAGAEDIEDCNLCESEYYLSPSGECKPCPRHAVCPRNTTLETLRLVAGYWRLSSQSTKVYHCLGLPRNESETLPGPCAGGTHGDAICSEGHKGPLCQVCEDESHYYSHKSAACLKCPMPTDMLVAGCVALAVLGLVWLHQQSFPQLDGLAVPLRRLVTSCGLLWSHLRLTPRLKLLFAFTQLISSLDRIYDVIMPRSWHTFVRAFDWQGHIEAALHIYPSQCVVGRHFKDRLLLQALLPLAFICAMPLIGAISNMLHLRFTRTRTDTAISSAFHAACGWLPISLVLAFCFTPSVSELIFKAWDCHSFVEEEGDESRVTYLLSGDLTVQCDGTHEHSTIQLVAWLLVLVWPIGMVVLYASLLIACRKQLLQGLTHSPLVQATAFLHRDYKSSYYWWEVAAMVHRSVLMGWLQLISHEAALFQLLAALVLTLAFLDVLLICQPYERRLDTALAAATHVLLVCVLLGSMMIRLYKIIVDDMDGSTEFARRVLGFYSPESILDFIVVVSLVMLCSFVAALLAESFSLFVQRRQREQWSGATINPPVVRSWKRQADYACFLSHYKQEAASDARLMHDMLQKMLRAPVFIDSVNLVDLRDLISNGVHRSDAVVLLATKNVLQRPWCVLELFEAWRRRIPVVVVEVEGRDFTYENAKHFVRHLEEIMRHTHCEGLDFLFQRLGPDLSELKRALFNILGENEHRALTFNPFLPDEALVASIKDIIEAIAARHRVSIDWIDEEGSRSLAKQKAKLSHPWKGIFNCVPRVRKRAHKDPPSFFICCSRHASDTSMAQVVARALLQHCGRSCAIGGANNHDLLNHCEIAVVLLSKHTLTDPWALFDMYRAVQQNLPMATVAVINQGYDFAEATRFLGSLWNQLNSESPAAAQVLDALLPEGTSVDQAGQVVLNVLSSLIAISWPTHPSKHNLRAMAQEIVSRIPPKTCRPYLFRLKSHALQSQTARGERSSPRSPTQKAPNLPNAAVIESLSFTLVSSHLRDIAGEDSDLSA